MMTPRPDPRPEWNRLEDALGTIKPGDTITVDTLVAETGLTEETVETVLNALTKMQLFDRKPGNAFLRRRLFEACVPFKAQHVRDALAGRRSTTAVSCELRDIQKTKSESGAQA